MNKNILPFDKFHLHESEDDLLKDLKSLGYENKYNWETIVKAMKSMKDLEGYITINWSGDDLLTRSDSNIKDGVYVYLLNLEYPEDLFGVNADEKRFIEDFLKKLEEYNGSVDGWTLREIEDAFKELDVEDVLARRVDRKKGKVSFSVETDTNMKSDQFGVSVTIKKEKDPPIINIDQSIKDILSDLEYYLEKLDDRTTR
jgi:hypothetical protein